MIINIRGTNGSGKSHIIKSLLNMYKYEIINDNILFIKDLDLYVVGKYLNKDGEFIPTGGCDQLDARTVYTFIYELRNENVIFEGAAESTVFNKWSTLASEVGFHNFIFIFLDTPIEKCIKQREERRKGRKSNFDNSTLIKNHAVCKIVRHKLRHDGHAVYELASKDVIKFIHQVFNENSDDYRNWLEFLSGSGKRTGTYRIYGLYCSVNLPLFNDMPAVRDIEKRYKEFGIDKIEGSVIDYGCNCGSLIFESFNHGATSGTGYEYSPSRVLFCNKVARRYGLNCKFYQYDLNIDLPHITADYVFCCSVDEYINNVDLFYSHLRMSTKKKLFFECNIQRSVTVDLTVRRLMTAGFKKVSYLGNGDSGGISRKRKIYICE